MLTVVCTCIMWKLDMKYKTLDTVYKNLTTNYLILSTLKLIKYKKTWHWELFAVIKAKNTVLFLLNIVSQLSLT